MLDQDLLDKLDQLKGESFSGSVWRVTAAMRDPLTGSAAGGRLTPANSFEALYLSVESDGAMAEAYYHLSLAPVFASCDFRLNQISVGLNNVLKLEEEQLGLLNVEQPMELRPDYTVKQVTQDTGEAAHMFDYEGLMVPSVRWDCFNIVLFVDQIDVGTQIELIDMKEINWPAWRETIGG